MVRSKKARANWTSSKWRRSQQKKRKSSTCDSDVASSSFWGQSQRGFSAQTLDNGSNNLHVTVVGCTSRHSNICFFVDFRNWSYLEGLISPSLILGRQTCTRKRWQKGFQKLRKASLLSALSPLQSIGAGSRQLCGEFLEAMPANSCQWPHSAETQPLPCTKMRPDCNKKCVHWMLCLDGGEWLRAHLLTWEPKGTRHHNQEPSNTDLLQCISS